MGYLSTNLATNLSTGLSTSFCPVVKAQFKDATFTNANARYLSYGDTAPSVTEFAGGVLATRRIGGKLFAQIELAVENVSIRNQEFDNAAWSKTRCSVDANDTTDPLGTSTADFVKEDSSAASTHPISDTLTVDGSSDYVFSIYAKANGRNWIRLLIGPTRFVAAASVYCDLDNGVLSTEVGSPLATGIEDAGNGWYRCYVSQTSNDAGGNPFTVNLADSDGGVTYDGDGSSGVYLWNAQLEIGTYPTSPIKTEAAAVTRAKDQLLWPSADVPAALRGKITWKWIPYHDNTETANRYFWQSNGAGERVRCIFNAATDKILVYDIDAPGNLVVSDAMTFSRLQEITITVDPTAGSLTISGASTGNGTNTDTAWSTTKGDFSWGMSNAFGYQCNGLQSEPY